MKSHRDYRNSGIEWLGEVPSHWKLVKLRFVVSKIDEPTLVNDFVVAVENIESKTGKFIATEENNYTGQLSAFKKGDVLFNKLRPYLAKVFYAEKGGAISGELLVLRSGNAIHSKFLYYRLLSDDFIQEVNSSTEGTKMPRANWEDVIKQIKIGLPSINEQIQCASFLDNRINRLDFAIERKRQLINLLQEEKAAIINHAVTKGIDETAPMRPSGIEWLGDIPTHWEVKKVKYVASMRSGSGITSDEILPEGDFPVFGGNGVRGFYTSYTHDGDFVLIGRQGALCGNVKLASGKFWASEHAVVCSILGANNYEWLGALLQTMNLNQYSQAAAQPGLAVEVISNLKIPVPPNIEQKGIIEFIKNESRKIDTAIIKIEKEIELLTEYKTSLIYVVVTGKVKVFEEKPIADVAIV